MGHSAQVELTHMAAPDAPLHMHVVVLAAVQPFVATAQV
jgi:hypothetical protein